MKHVRFVHLVFMTFVFGAAAAFSQVPQQDTEAIRLTKVATAVRAKEKISVDGHLEEPSWQEAVPLTGFIQREPRTGQPMTERTEVRVLYDENNLYVGVNAFDSDAAHITVTELKEDFNVLQSDGITVVIDALHDHRSGFAFGTNPAGAKRDNQITNDNQSNGDWDGVWDAKVTRDDEGYIVEYVIPFKTLRFSHDQMQEWGFNISRRILRTNEEGHWSPQAYRYRQPRIGSAGTLKGLEGIHQGRNLKVKPYVVAGLTDVRGVKTSNNSDAGVDLKYSLTPSLTLDGTYRTDFAQVEVDQQQVNLTRFNLFFPEKRDFFLENAGIFSVGTGSQGNTGAGTANLSPFFSRKIGLSSAGTPIPIVGGARVTGRINQYDVGFLQMKTESLGAVPANNFTIGRLKRNFFGNSWIGGLVTNRDSALNNDYNRVYGADAYFQFFQKLEFDTYLYKSDTPNRTGDDYARKFATAWRGDDLIVAGEYNSVQTNFNPEVGFIRRRDVTDYSGEFQYLPRIKHPVIRNFLFQTSYDYYQNPESRKFETRVQSVTGGLQFLNNTSLTFNAEQTFDRLTSVFLIRSRRAGNPADLPIAAGDYEYVRYTGKFNTNNRRKVSGSGTVSTGGFWNGDRKQFTGALTLRPNYHINMDLSLDKNRVTLPNGSFTTNLIGARIVYAFSPRAFLNAFFQYNTDTHLVSSNIRFNIIHHPLSDLYIVFNDNRDARSGMFVDRAVMLKLTNLFNF